MEGKSVLKAIVIGISTGIVLSVFLKVVQLLTDDKVYTLLLNVDYFPVLKEGQFNELVEVSFHLIVSVILCLIIAFLYTNTKGFIRKHIILFTFLVNVVIGLFLFPTTFISSRTPELTDWSALFWWLAGHGLYGLAAGTMFKRVFAIKDII